MNKKLLLLVTLISFILLVSGCDQLQNYVGFAGYTGKLTTCSNVDTQDCYQEEYYYAAGKQAQKRGDTVTFWTYLRGPYKGCNELGGNGCWCPLADSSNLKEVNLFFSGDDKGTNTEGVEWFKCVNGQPPPECSSKPFYYVSHRSGVSGWEKMSGPYQGCTSVNWDQEWCATDAGLKKTTLFDDDNTVEKLDFKYCAAAQPQRGIDLGLNRNTREAPSAIPDLGRGLETIDTQTSDRIREIEFQLEQANINSCFESGCYDTDGYNTKTKGKVYVKKAASRKDFADGLPTKVIDDYTYSCRQIEDYCKGSFVIEQTCQADPAGGPSIVKTQGQNCVCGCLDGACQECIYPDLVVKKIYTPVLSKQCANSFYFNICNEGKDKVNKPFKIAISANGVTKDTTMDLEYKKLKPGVCLDISFPGLFAVGSFGLDLKKNVDVTVELDVKGEIQESDKSNNKKTTKVFTGDAYYYDETLKCDTFCYETDAGHDIYKQGNTTYKYTGKINTKEDHCSWDGLAVVEFSCDLPIKLKENKKFTNPLKEVYVDCLGQANPGSCINGKCVPFPKNCKDSFGKKIPCLTCQEFGEKGQDLSKKATLTSTDINNKKTTTVESCKESESYNDKDPDSVIDYYCKDLGGGVSILKKNIWSCLQEGLDEGKGNFYACEDGTCKNKGKLDVQCIGPKENEIDNFKSSKVVRKYKITTKVLGVDSVKEKQEGRSDYCSSDDEARKYYCQGNNYKSKKINCDLLKDKNGKGATCVNGACSFFNENLKSCTEEYDKGIDPTNPGWVNYVSGYGYKGSKGDNCESEEILLEAYCNGKDAHFKKISCKDQGKVCKEGKCTIFDPKLKACSETDNGKDAYNDGKITWTTEFGITKKDSDWCKDKTTVEEKFCDGKEKKVEEIKCNAGDQCVWGECVKADEKNLACNEYGDKGKDTTTKGTVESKNKFGQWDNQKDSCKDKSTITEWSCNGKLPQSDEIKCAAGLECKEGACRKYDPSKISCTENGDKGKDAKVKGYMVSMDAWGITTETFDVCAGGSYAGAAIGTAVNEYYCDGKKLASTEIKCAAGEKCVLGACRKEDQSQMQCFDIYDKGKDTSKLGVSLSIDKYGLLDDQDDDCDSINEVEEAFCKNKEIDEEVIKCKSNEVCANGACTKPKKEVNGCIELYESGLDSNTLGLVGMIKDNGAYFEDKCKGDILLEWQCSAAGKITPQEIDCSKQGKICVNGACWKNDKSSFKCTEYLDKGFDETVRGVLAIEQFGVPDGRYDSCKHADILGEWRCDGNEAESKNIDCAKLGKTCSEGKCV